MNYSHSNRGGWIVNTGVFSRILLDFFPLWNRENSVGKLFKLLNKKFLVWNGEKTAVESEKKKEQFVEKKGTWKKIVFPVEKRKTRFVEKTSCRGYF